MSYPVTNLSLAYGSGLLNPMGGETDALFNQFRAPIGAVFTTQDVTLMHSANVSQAFPGTLNRLGGMQEAIKISQRDIWRNVRIPFLHTLDGYDPQVAEYWLPVSNDSIPGYSSMIGTPVRGFPPTQSGNTSFVVKTNYQVLQVGIPGPQTKYARVDPSQCKPWLNAIDWKARNNGSLLVPHDDERIKSMNQGKPNIQLNVLRDPVRSRVPPFPFYEIELPRPRMHLVFQSRRNLTICDVRTEYVESGIECARASRQGDLACHATKVRRSPLGPESKDYENVTALDVGRNMIILQHMPYTLASNTVVEPSFLEKWLKDPPSSLPYSNDYNKLWYEDVPLDVFSDRLSMVLNTYLHATLNATFIFGSDGMTLEARDETWDNTTGTWTEFTAPVYQLHKVWFSLYMISAAVLTIAALINILLRIWTHSPDFLNSISALTRDSAFIQVPTPASTLDGSDRARLLRDTWVMIQDVQPDGKLGRIALSDAVEAVALRTDREYT